MTATLKVPLVRRSQSDRRQQSESELLRAAAELILERGMAAATFENIGARAGYSRGLATQKFGSKQGLIEALIVRLQARLQDLLADRQLDCANGLEAILGFVDIYLRNLAEDGEMRAYFVLMAGAVAEVSDLRGPFAAVHKEVETRLEAMFLRGQAEGVIREGLNADAAALMVGALLLGLSTQMLVDPGLDLEPIRETSLATLRVSFSA
ncbi:TetR/AcrR family transcriptional regulator [Caulobacter sp. ErkDOM-YI]|uniref:TetR/AcrR family transcriptional regulator n=1 Tax=unclassified Caulobacter TaxID=2648921 RepID=UPI003AF79B7D